MSPLRTDCCISTPRSRPPLSGSEAAVIIVIILLAGSLTALGFSSDEIVKDLVWTACIAVFTVMALRLSGPAVALRVLAALSRP